MKGWLRGTLLSEGDRLSITFTLSLAVHAFVVFGIGFAWSLPDQNRTPPMMEVTLAESPQEEAPDEHDFIASENQQGGGEAEQAEEPEQASPQSSTSDSGGEQSVNASPPASDKPAREQDQVTGNQDVETTPEEQAPENDKEMSRSEIIDDTRQVASDAALERAREAVDAKYPSKRYIRARTKSHVAASYMRQWVNKVEKIGNLNYPEEARERNLSGRLTLEVTLRPDGTVRQIKTLSSSRHPALDQAAERIVDLAAPFADIPEKVLQGDDLLVITRSWEFDNGLDTGSAR